MNNYERKIIGGIVAGVIKASDIDLSSSDFPSDEAGDSITAAQILESEGITVDAGILHSRLAPNSDSFYTSDDFRLMAKSVDGASVVWVCPW
jgi:hypothetical protein